MAFIQAADSTPNGPNNNHRGVSAVSVARSLSVPDVAIMPFIVESVLRTADFNPGAVHEMLALTSRFHGSVDESDASTGSGNQLKRLLYAVDHAPQIGSPKEIARMKQVRLVAKCMLAKDGGTSLMGDVVADLHTFGDLLPVEILQSLLSSSDAALCTVITGHIAGCLGAEDGQRMAVEGDWFFTITGALLSNDAFFTPSQFDGMHASLLKLVQCTRLVNPQDRGVVPVFNKASRVYAKQAAGAALQALDKAFFSQYPAAVKLLPWQYHVRCLGALFDEERANGLSEEALTTFSHTSCQRFWNDHIGSVSRTFLSLHSQTHQALETYWKMLFKAAMLLPGEELAFYRSVRAYKWYAAAGAPVAMTKDGLAQITRLLCEAMRTSDLNASNACSSVHTDSENITTSTTISETTLHLSSDLPNGWLTEVIAEFTSVLSKTPSATFHWGLNVMDALYKALSESTVLSTQHKKAAADQIYTWVTEDFFPTKKVTGTDPFNVSSIRRQAESIGIVEPSVFWWTCGCGSSNPSGSDTCSQCMRGNHVRWVCTHPKCRTSHTDPGLQSCTKCRVPHPFIQAATKLSLQLCSTCIFSPVDASTGTCQRCVGKAKEAATQSSQRTQKGTNTLYDKYSFMCGSCKMHHNSQVHCPSCGLKTNPDEDLSMWHCSTCHNYNFSFNKMCSRCHPKKTPRTTSALRAPYSTWTCGCGESNPMIRLSCHACDKKQKAQSTGMPKGFTCAACSKYSSPTNWSTISVTPDHGNPTKLDGCSCADCGEYHPREVAVLNSAGLSHPCFSCGSALLAGSTTCPRCEADQASFSSLLPFWCESCTEMKGTGQVGFECASCRTVRPELRNAAFLWKCERASSATGGGPCEAWNPSWSPSCSCCKQARVLDINHEIRARHSGRWTCGSCKGVNEPEDMLMCPRGGCMH